MFTFPLTCRKLPLYLSIENVGLCIFGMYFCLQYPDSFLGRDGQFSGWTEPQPCPGILSDVSHGSHCPKFADDFLSHDNNVMEDLK